MNLGAIKPVLAALALLATASAFAQKTQLTVYTALETDQLKAYEAGFKSDLLDRRLRVNGAVFLNKYKDIQLTVNNCPFPGVPPTPCALPVNAGTADVKGAEIETEVWRLPAEGLGRLLTTLPRPMALGSVQLVDGTRVPGFLCEPGALTNAEDITRYGSWRCYLNAPRL